MDTGQVGHDDSYLENGGKPLYNCRDVTVPLTGITSNGLSQFFSFLLSYLIFSDFELWGDSPQELTYLMTFTNTCLSHGEPCFIKPNFILDSSFPCCAWLCCHTHAPPSCPYFSSILPLPCGCIMLLIFAMCYDSLLRLCSFPHLILLCHISFPGVPFLCLSSLSSYPGTPYIHHTRPLTPMPFLALLPDRGYPLLIAS